jgi:hypothetical protein
MTLSSLKTVFFFSFFEKKKIYSHDQQTQHQILLLNKQRKEKKRYIEGRVYLKVLCSFTFLSLPREQPIVVNYDKEKNLSPTSKREEKKGEEECTPSLLIYL